MTVDLLVSDRIAFQLQAARRTDPVMQILPISSATSETIVQLAERRLRESPYFY